MLDVGCWLVQTRRVASSSPLQVMRPSENSEGALESLRGEVR